MIRRILLALTIVLLSSTNLYAALPVADGSSNLWVVRTDGGTDVQCNGHYDAAVGSAPNCAFSHPYYVLPPIDSASAIKTSDGDYVYIASGSYPMSADAGAVAASCGGDDRCWNKAPSDNVKIYGEGWDTGCNSFENYNLPATAPNPAVELYATEGTRYTLRFSGTSGIDLRCLEITDHVEAIYTGTQDHPSKINIAEYSTDRGRDGILAVSATDVTMKYLWVHGFPEYNIILDSVGVDADWVVVTGSGWDGWEFGKGSIVGGVWAWDHVEIGWAGCVEEYPISGAVTYDECCAQGPCGLTSDGFGGSKDHDGTFDFRITDSDIHHNTSDGVDIRYIGQNSSVGGSKITIKRTRFEGNAGDQLKSWANYIWIENSKFLANCDWHRDSGAACTTADGCAYNWSGGDNACRGGGNAISNVMRAGNFSTYPELHIYNSTFYGQGNSILYNAGATYCDGSAETVNLENSILYWPALDYSGVINVNYYVRDGGDCKFPVLNNVVAYECDAVNCPSGAEIITGDPLFSEAEDMDAGAMTTADLDVTLSSTSSSAYDAGDEAVALTEDVDFNNWARGANWEIGAYEYDTQTTGGGATCSSSCAECASQGLCEASTATNCDATGFCCWQTGATQCSDTPEPDCDDSCSLCSTQTPCEESTATCYWWSDSACYSSEEPASCSASCSACENQSTCEASGVPCDWSDEGVKEDFSLFDEVDPAGDIVVSTFDITVDTMQSGVTSFVQKFLGTDHLADFIQESDATITARNDGQLIGVWAVNDGASTIATMNSGGQSGYTLTYGSNGGTVGWYLEYFGSAGYAYDHYVDTTGMPFTRYFRHTRSGSNMTTQIYSDAAKTSLLDTITVAGDAVALDYVFGLINRGVAGVATGSLTSNNLILNETTQCVAESAATCDTDCTVCISQQGCEGSATTCYWHTDNTCNVAAEVPAIAADGSMIDGGSITGGSI